MAKIGEKMLLQSVRIAGMRINKRVKETYAREQAAKNYT